MKFFVVLAFVALSCCFFTSASASKSWVLDESANNTNITPTVGDTILVQLKGNPTTGFKWILECLSGDVVSFGGRVRVFSSSLLDWISLYIYQKRHFWHHFPHKFFVRTGSQNIWVLRRRMNPLHRQPQTTHFFSLAVLFYDLSELPLWFQIPRHYISYISASEYRPVQFIWPNSSFSLLDAFLCAAIPSCMSNDETLFLCFSHTIRIADTTVVAVSTSSLSTSLLLATALSSSSMLVTGRVSLPLLSWSPGRDLTPPTIKAPRQILTTADSSAKEKKIICFLYSKKRKYNLLFKTLLSQDVGNHRFSFTNIGSLQLTQAPVIVSKEILFCGLDSNQACKQTEWYALPHLGLSHIRSGISKSPIWWS